MTTFKTDRPALARYIFKDWLIIVTIFALAAIYGLLFSGKPITIKDSYFWIVGGVMLVSLAGKIKTDLSKKILTRTTDRSFFFIKAFFLIRNKKRFRLIMQGWK